MRASSCSRLVPFKRLRSTGLMLLLTTLGGCGYDRVVTNTVAQDDYHARHPIVLTEGLRALDVFPATGGSGIDRESQLKIMEFARLSREAGATQMNVQLPGGIHEASSRIAIEPVRRALVAGGAAGALSISSYPASDPQTPAPIRLSFRGLKAKVATTCGQWPGDLASGATNDGWDNKQYYNYGCATQTALAAQIADPRDLAGPRAEQASDFTMRSRAITNVRQGIDPGTSWKIKNTDIGQIGSGQ